MDSHHHGHGHHHSHRSGPATRYWREPKPVLLTVLSFLLLLLFVNFTSKPASFDSKQAGLAHSILPKTTRSVVWHDYQTENAAPHDAGVVYFRRIPEQLDTSCEFRKAWLMKLHGNELGLVRFVACSTLECAWTMHSLLKLADGSREIHFLLPNALRDAAAVDALSFINAPFQVHFWDTYSLATLTHFVATEMAEGVASNALPSSNQEQTWTALHCTDVFPFPQVLSSVGSCPLAYHYREDVKLCLRDSQRCAMLTTKACALDAEHSKCAEDCSARFSRELRAETVRWQTFLLCLITLFLLGCVLGLLFAKLYWVDPLLDLNERLQNSSASKSNV